MGEGSNGGNGVPKWAWALVVGAFGLVMAAVFAGIVQYLAGVSSGVEANGRELVGIRVKVERLKEDLGQTVRLRDDFQRHAGGLQQLRARVERLENQVERLQQN